LSGLGRGTLHRGRTLSHVRCRLRAFRHFHHNGAASRTRHHQKRNLQRLHAFLLLKPRRRCGGLLRFGEYPVKIN
jgi:hypothetical protein